MFLSFLLPDLVHQILDLHWERDLHPTSLGSLGSALDRQIGSTVVFERMKSANWDVTLKILGSIHGINGYELKNIERWKGQCVTV